MLFRCFFGDNVTENCCEKLYSIINRFIVDFFLKIPYTYFRENEMN